MARVSPGKMEIQCRVEGQKLTCFHFQIFVKEVPYGMSEFLFGKLCLLGHDSYHRDDRESKFL